MEGKKIIVLGLLSAAAFAVLMLVFSLLIPSRIRISRATNIQASGIGNTISQLSTWKQWNDLYAGTGNVTITAVSDTLIQTLWSRGDQRIPANFVLVPRGGITVVQWYFDVPLRWYPWEKLGSITLDQQFGPPMEHSLMRLKQLLEKSP